MSEAGDALRVLPGDIVLVRELTPHHLAHAPGADCLRAAGRDGHGHRGVAQRQRRRPDRRIADLVLLRRVSLRGRSVPRAARRAARHGAAAPGVGQHAAGDDGPPGARDAARRAGQQALLDRLLDVALVQILREHFNDRLGTAPGWFRASADPRVGEALRAVHADPARQWTVADMAEHALLSRSAFARRFTDLVGAAPLAYLNDWRMALARERLRDTDARLAEIGKLARSTPRSSLSRPRSSATTGSRRGAGANRPASLRTLSMRC